MIKKLRDLEQVWSSSPFVYPAWDKEALGSDFFARHQSDYEHLLSRLQKDPSPLLSFLAQTPRTYKLGLYAQALFEFVLRHLPGVEVLAVDLPCWSVTASGSRATQGALDFLFRDLKTSEVVHAEFAVKIMLRQATPAGRSEATAGRSEALSDWIGPEGRDRLDLKLRKMQERQMPLIRHPAIQAELLRRFQLSVSEVKSVSVLRGMGFVEPGSEKSSVIVRTEHLLGEWCPISEGTSPERSEWIRIPKIEWLSPLTSDELVDLEVLGREADPQESGGFGLYQSLQNPSQRVFLVHADWPHPRPEALIGKSRTKN